MAVTRLAVGLAVTVLLTEAGPDVLIGCYEGAVKPMYYTTS